MSLTKKELRQIIIEERQIVLNEVAPIAIVAAAAETFITAYAAEKFMELMGKEITIAGVKVDLGDIKKLITFFKLIKSPTPENIKKSLLIIFKEALEQKAEEKLSAIIDTRRAGPSPLSGVGVNPEPTEEDRNKAVEESSAEITDLIKPVLDRLLSSAKENISFFPDTFKALKHQGKKKAAKYDITDVRLYYTQAMSVYKKINRMLETYTDEFAMTEVKDMTIQQIENKNKILKALLGVMIEFHDEIKDKVSKKGHRVDVTKLMDEWGVAAKLTQKIQDEEGVDLSEEPPDILKKVSNAYVFFTYFKKVTNELAGVLNKIKQGSFVATTEAKPDDILQAPEPTELQAQLEEILPSPEAT